MDAGKQKAVPLCLPENWLFNGQTVTGDPSKCRGNMKLCREGMQLLNETGDDKIAVICIIGPARSGKSYLLSKLLDEVSFEVGHGPVSKTTGIWIACSQDKKEIEGNRKSRIVLLDAEGAGSVATEDDSVSREWDTKLYSLCCLLSSLVIYNSKKTPECGDLERLQFVGNFSKAVSATDQTSACYKSYAPKLLWILRDVLHDPEPYKDWEDYFGKKVLVKRPERGKSDISFNGVVDAIDTFFQSFTVKALPPPSSEKEVCRNLEKPEHYENIKGFLAEIEDAKRLIFTLTSIKKAGNTAMTGKRLLHLLNIYVKELNKESGEISIKTCWDANISLHLENIIQPLYEKLEQEVSNIQLPLKEQEMKDKHSDVADKIKESFLKNIFLKDDKLVCCFLEKLRKKVGRSIKSLQRRNITASELFCEAKAEEITKAHLENIRRNTSSPSILEQLKLYENVIETICEEYVEATQGLPQSEEIFKSGRIKISKQIQSINVWLILNKICENYKMHMKSITLPVEETKLIEENREAKSQAYNSCREEETYVQNSDTFHKQREDKISSLFGQFKADNERESQSVCNDAMNEIVRNLQAKIDNPSLFDYLFSVNEKKFVSMYRKKAIGPQKSEIEMKVKNQLKILIPKANAVLSRKTQEFVAKGKRALIVGGAVTVTGVGMVLMFFFKARM